MSLRAAPATRDGHAARSKRRYAIWIGLGLLLGVVGVSVRFIFLRLDSGDLTRDAIARNGVRNLNYALGFFYRDEHRFPSQAEGLSALVPSVISYVPKDPWDRAYIYRYDGSGAPTVYSTGPNRLDEQGGGDDVGVRAP